MSIGYRFPAAVLFGVALSACRGAQSPPPAAPQPSNAVDVSTPAETMAKEILAAMAKAYAECSSYRDQGTVTTKIIGPGITKRLAFKTAFVRKDVFRFEFADTDGHAAGKPYIVWADPTSIQSWWFMHPGVKQHTLLSMALAGATGVSAGSAHTVPRLLMPVGVGGGALTDVVHPRLDGEEAIDGRVCLKIVTKYPAGSPLTIWVDKETHLVRQLLESHDFTDHGFSTEKATTYLPEVDVTIDAAELKFNPPEDSDDDANG